MITAASTAAATAAASRGRFRLLQRCALLQRSLYQIFSGRSLIHHVAILILHHSSSFSCFRSSRLARVS